MAMVALAALVVVTHSTGVGCTEKQAVLITMHAWRQGVGQFPDNSRDYGAIVAYLIGAGEQDGHKRAGIDHKVDGLPGRLSGGDAQSNMPCSL